MLKRTDTHARMLHAEASEFGIAFAGSWSAGIAATRQEEVTMLYTIAVILLVAWLLGLVGTFTIGPMVHVLVVIAVALLVVAFLTGRRSVV